VTEDMTVSGGCSTTGFAANARTVSHCHLDRTVMSRVFHARMIRRSRPLRSISSYRAWRLELTKALVCGGNDDVPKPGTKSVAD
jgi:hypothetical protein